MKKLNNVFLVVFAGIILGNSNLIAQDITKDETLEALTRATGYFMHKFPDPRKGMPAGNKSNGWLRSLSMEGLMDFYAATKEDTILDYLIRWGESNRYSLPEGINSSKPENIACGQTYLELYMLDRYKEDRIRNIRQCVDSIVAGDKTDSWDSVDDLQMAMPVFAMLGNIHDRDSYIERMNEMYSHTRDALGLYNAEEHLWWYDKSFKPPYKEPGGADCYTSAGNGWVIAAIVRTLDHLPKNSKYRKDYQNTLSEMCEALLPLQREDGFWNVSLKDPGNFGGKELTGTALIIYGMAWGIRADILDKDDYLKPVLKGWKAVVADALHADGSLGFVKGPGRAPGDGQPVTYESKAGNEDLGLGCYLLAGNEVYLLLQSMEPKPKVKKVKEEKVKEEKAVRDKPVKTEKKARKDKQDTEEPEQ